MSMDSFWEAFELEKQSENWSTAGCAVVTEKWARRKARSKKIPGKARHVEPGSRKPAMGA